MEFLKDRSNDSSFFWCFMAVCMILGIGSHLFFQYHKNVRVKRKMFSVLTVGGGILFALFVVFIFGKLEVLLLAVPAVVLVTYLNHRMTHFCDSCGRMVHVQVFFSKARYCPLCGAKLNKESQEDNPTGKD